MINKILCPTDFSKAATNAVEYAALVAQKTRASLTLLHVLHLPLLDTTETALVAGEVLGEQKRHAAEKLHALSRHLAEKFHPQSLQVDYQVQESLLADAVQGLTKTGGYDFVVVGSTGGGNTLEEILIGSNTESVIEHVRCPVLTVPAKASATEFKKIVFASKYHEEDVAALHQVLDFAHLFGAQVEVVHVSAEATDQHDSRARRYQEKIDASLPEHLSFHEVVHPDEVVGMKGYLTEKHADLLVILKKRKGFFHNLFSQSFSEQLTYQSKLPMLIIHE